MKRLTRRGHDPPLVYRFGDFQLDAETLELFRSSERVPLQPQPARLLALLIARAGRMVTREEIQRALWPETFVEFDQSLNRCVSQVRAALGENASSPLYIETLPRRGYRFIAIVEAVRGGGGTERRRRAGRFARRRHGRRAVGWVARTAAAVVVVAATMAVARVLDRNRPLRVESLPDDLRFEFAQGEYHLSKPGGAQRAVQFLETVVEEAPEFAPGWATLARARLRMGAPAQADLDAARALELDDTRADAYLVRAEAARARLDFNAAQILYDRVFSMSSEGPDAHVAYAFFLVTTGRTDEALEHARSAYANDPVSALLVNDLGVLHLWAGDAGSAIRLCSRAVEIDPSVAFPHRCLLRANEIAGDSASAVASAAAILKIEGADEDAVDALRREPPFEALRTYRRWELGRLEGVETDVARYRAGALLAELCLVDDALAILRRLSTDAGMFLPSIGVNPAFACASTHPGFQSILADVALESQHGALAPSVTDPGGSSFR